MPPSRHTTARCGSPGRFRHRQLSVILQTRRVRWLVLTLLFRCVIRPITLEKGAQIEQSVHLQFVSNDPLPELSLPVAAALVKASLRVRVGNGADAGTVPMLGLALSGATGERSPAASALAAKAGFLHVTYDTEHGGSADTLISCVGRSWQVPAPADTQTVVVALLYLTCSRG